MSMKIDIFEPISFCFGVQNSLKIIDETITKYNDRQIFCMGQPIHNELISKKLKDRGVNIIISELANYEEEILLMPNESVIIFSAHGHDKKLDGICELKNMIIIDCVCPIVKNIQLEINKFINDDAHVIFIGKQNHPESYAICKNAPKVKFWDISSRYLVDIQYKNTIIFNQTTILNNKLLPIFNELNNLNRKITIKNTSCKFVTERYKKLVNLDINNYDFLIIAGSTTSSNTMELFNTAINLFGKEKCILISHEDDIKTLHKLVKTNDRIAIFSGTSAPPYLIENIKKALMQ